MIWRDVQSYLDECKRPQCFDVIASDCLVEERSRFDGSRFDVPRADRLAARRELKQALAKLKRAGSVVGGGGYYGSAKGVG